MQTVQLHELPFQFLIKLLHWIGFSDVLIWKGRLFQTFGPYTFKVFSPKVTWFHSGVSRFSLYCSLINLLFSLTLKILFINSGFNLLFYIFHHTNSSTYLHSFLLFLLFPVNLHKILSNHSRSALFWRLSTLFRDLAVGNIQARRQ